MDGKENLRKEQEIYIKYDCYAKNRNKFKEDFFSK